MSSESTRTGVAQRLSGGAHWLAELFGRSELFVDRKGFAAWLAAANLKAAALGSPGAVEAAMTAFAGRPLGPTMVGDVAVIEVNGPITYKSSWYSYYFGGACIQDLQQQFRAALADPAVKTIVFKVDSPGGVIDMMPEFADELFAARGQKPMIGVADTLIASCAYWMASQLETLYASMSAQLGAIGVYCEHDDISGMLEKAGVKITLIAHGDHKVDGNPYEPLSDAARADLQANVDEIGDWFDNAVARGRGVKKSVVLEQFGQGKVFRGKKAITLGLADKPGTFGQVMAKLTKGRAGAAPAVARAAAAAAPATPMVEGDTAPAPVEGTKKSTQACASCAKSSCTCTEDECPSDCPTCDPTCPCVAPIEDDDDAAKKAAANRDAAAITAALAD